MISGYLLSSGSSTTYYYYVCQYSKGNAHWIYTQADTDPNSQNHPPTVQKGCCYCQSGTSSTTGYRITNINGFKWDFYRPFISKQVPFRLYFVGRNYTEYNTLIDESHWSYLDFSAEGNIADYYLDPNSAYTTSSDVTITVMGFELL